MQTRLLLTVALLFPLAISPLAAESPNNPAEARAQYGAADTDLNKVYQDLLRKLDEASKKKLKESQRAWLAYRDAEAAFVVAESGGTISRITYWISMEETTRQRVAQLKSDFP